jgi:RimJ/RimL family protein N-acetyltransferase
MNLAQFYDTHAPALELDEARHNLILGVTAPALSKPDGFGYWTLGAPGECAVQYPGRPLLLGALSRAQCHSFAELTKELDYPGVVGSGETALWFMERARELGLSFHGQIPQRIHTLTSDPIAPSVPGFARQICWNDFDVFQRWTLAFGAEAVPHDRSPTADAMQATLGQGRHWFWIADGMPVSMAAVARRTKNAACINSVYTSPDHRNRGFAGAVTAAVAQEIFSEGRNTVCLYTDLRNAASNRCYAKIGFKPVCDSWHMVR